MEYCANCGSKMEQSDMGCTACGSDAPEQQPVETTKNQDQVTTSADNVETQQTGDNTMSSGEAPTSNMQIQPTPVGYDNQQPAQVDYNYQTPQEKLYAENFNGTLLDAVKTFYFEPQNSLSLFASRKNPSILVLVLLNLILGFALSLLQSWKTGTELTATLISFVIGGSIFFFLLLWGIFSIILYIFFHTTFEYGTFARSSFALWFKFTAYLMILSCLNSILKIILVFLASPVTLSFPDSDVLLVSLPLWYIIIGYVSGIGETALAAIVAYKVLKNGFNFDGSKPLLMALVIFVPIFIFSTFGVLLAYFPFAFANQ